MHGGAWHRRAAVNSLTIMTHGFRRIGKFLGLLWGLVAAAATAADPQAAIRHLPANNPYRAAIEEYLGLPEEDRTRLVAWARKTGEGDAPPPVLTAEQRARVADLSAAVLAAARQPQAAEWPLVPDPADPENPAAITVPHVGPIMQLARIVNRSAADLPPGEAIDRYAAVAQLGRQARNGGTLIDQLAGVAAEGLATGETSRRLGEFSGADLDRLTAAWAALKPSPGLDAAFRGERDLFFKPLLEKIIGPGLAAMLAEENALSGTVTAPAANDVGAGLRLTAIINDGQPMIGLEERATGTAFFVREGKTVNGVSVLSIDFERNRAMLRVHGKEAVLDLVSKRIVERKAAVGRLFRLLGGMDGLSAGGGDEGPKIVADLLKHARIHPEGLGGYIKELQADYDRMLADELLRAERPKAEARDPASLRSENPLLALIMPSFESVARRINQSELAGTMLDAAVGLRRRQLNGSLPVRAAVDPWSGAGEGFRLTIIPDGGFILGSAYESAPGKPVEYKYGAPDAGPERKR